MDNGLVEKRFPKALGHMMQHQFFTTLRCSRRHPHHSSGVEIPAPFILHVSRFYNLVEVVIRAWIRWRPNTHMEALMQHVVEHLAVPGVSASFEVKVLVDSSSDITEISEGPIEVLQGHSGNEPNRVNAGIVEHERLVTSWAWSVLLRRNRVCST